MRSDELDFELPAELIAQAPSAERHSSRLLCYGKSDRSLAHLAFSDLPSRLRRGDLLVFNDAKVMPARFLLRKQTGGAVEGLFLAEAEPGHDAACFYPGELRVPAPLRAAGPPDSGL